MKKSTSKAIAFLSILIAGATALIGWLSVGFTDWNTANWSKKMGIEQTTDKPADKPTDKPSEEPTNNNNVVAITGKGESLSGTGTYAMPQAFAYTCAESDVNKSVTLTATVLPETASIKTISWSIAWVDSASTFASGKNVTDYVTITPSDDTSSCTITYVADFGSQIKVTATARDDSSKKADCIVDCLQKVNSVDIKTYKYSLHKITANEAQALYPKDKFVIETDATTAFGIKTINTNNILGINPCSPARSDFYDFGNNPSKLEFDDTYSAEYDRYQKNIISINIITSNNFTIADNYINQLFEQYGSNINLKLSLSEEIKAILISNNIVINSNSKDFTVMCGGGNAKGYYIHLMFGFNDLNSFFETNNKSKLKNIFLTYTGNVFDVNVEFNSTFQKQKFKVNSLKLDSNIFNIPVDSVTVDNGTVVV